MTASDDTRTDTLRIDRWLFFVRLFKTRTLASAAVSGGHVKLNGERATPGSKVRIGDVVGLVKERLPYQLEVAAIPVRRGPAPEARSCYTEEEAAVERREAMRAGIRQDRMLMPRTAGRPDKHTRRRLRRRNRAGD